MTLADSQVLELNRRSPERSCGWNWTKEMEYGRDVARIMSCSPDCTDHSKTSLNNQGLTFLFSLIVVYCLFYGMQCFSIQT